MKLLNIFLLISLFGFSHISFCQNKAYYSVQVVIPKDCFYSIEEIKEKGKFSLLIEDTSYNALVGEQNPMIESRLQIKFNPSGFYIDSIIYPSTPVLHALVYQLFDKQEILSTISFYPQSKNNTIYLQCSFFNRNPALFMNNLENDKLISFTTNITSKISSEILYDGCEIIQLKKEKRKLYAYYNKSYEINNGFRTPSFCDCNYDPNSKFIKSIKLNRRQIKRLKQYQKLIIEQYPNNFNNVIQRNVTYNMIDNRNIHFDIDRNNFELLRNIFWSNNN